MKRRTRLEVSPLEDRLTPVTGGFDVPFAADPDDPVGTAGSTLSGVVDINGTSTGALLARGAVVVGSNQILTAASAAPSPGQLVTFYERLPDGTLSQVQIPVLSVWVDPAFTAAGSNPLNNVGDVALVTLAAIAPFGTSAYPIYTGAQAAQASEVGKPYILAGFGATGNGTSGQAVSQELQRMTVTATGGAYSIVRPDTGQSSSVLQWNATAAQIQAAFASIGLPATVTQITVGPNAPVAGSPTVSYEVLFGGTTNLPQMSFASNPLSPLFNNGNNGTVTFATELDGGINPEYQRLTVTATGGSYRLSYNGTFTAMIPFNATAAQVEAALEALGAAGPGEVTVRQVTSGPNTGTYEIQFDKIGFAIPLLQTDTTTLTGTATVATIMDGGLRVLRTGANEYDSVAAGTLVSDLDPDGTDAFPGTGDAGSPGFITTSGGQQAIATVTSHGSGTTFGSTENDTRVSKYSADI
ncbi:MAG TPA: trypsin-like serine protease, partial [Urbifossiella sp.]|nr:trypsin-like serine protease [Urbifossiella sp.]